MKRCIVLLLVSLFVLTGCSHDIVKNTSKDLGWIVADNPNNPYPASAYAGGKQIFGDGRSSNDSDIFKIIENKIWH